ncbi:MAG: GNAT family N-acetyltransferase [Fimbriimonas sp.]
MVIRVATAADAVDVAALHVASWRATYRDIFPEEFLANEVEDDRLSFWQSRLSSCGQKQGDWVAVEDGLAVGFASANLDAHTEYGTLLANLHVLPGQQGKGIGRLLMGEVARWSLVHRPAAMLHLSVVVTNLGARGFYARLGGEEVASERWHSPSGDEVPCQVVLWRDPQVLTC